MQSPGTTRPASGSPYGAADWRALGTYVQIVVAGSERLDAARELAVRLLDDVDRACSRFREDSDLVRANAAAGRWVTVDPLLVTAVRTAVDAARRTFGLVDPTLGKSLAAAGYDRTFEAVRLGDGPAAVPVPALPGAWARIETRLERSPSGGTPDAAIRVPEGVALDLGATGKAFASDLVASSVSRTLRTGCVVSLGGDVAVGLPLPPDGSDSPREDAGPGSVPWPVLISERPDDPPVASVRLREGGLATSTVLARRWERGGHPVHHLLDPTTGRSVTVTWRTVSVRAATCVAANTASTAAVLLGAAAPRFLEREGVAARLVDESGEVTHVGDWREDEC
ncbi:MAG: FAD:protein transferase [Actinomycetota bacterium]|nr:FAD:protein transferase [Actinomycetota bacterium]